MAREDSIPPRLLENNTLYRRDLIDSTRLVIIPHHYLRCPFTISNDSSSHPVSQAQCAPAQVTLPSSAQCASHPVNQPTTSSPSLTTVSK